MIKQFKIRGEDIVQIIPNGSGCIATDRITVDGCELGYMYREVTSRANDTGWSFFAGDESPEYLADSNHSGVYALNTLANYEPAILAYIDTPAPCAFERIPGSRQFRRVEG
jgi:hypothetical protein